MKFKETLERFKAEEASPAKLTGGDGASVRSASRGNPEYEALISEAEQILVDALDKRTYFALGKLQEAMTTSDFPLLMGDILDRMLLAKYRARPQTFRAYCRVGRVRDFRTVKRLTRDGGRSALGATDREKIGERAPYPEKALTEGEFEYGVAKYGRRYGLSFEQLINDDLDAFSDLPEDMAVAASRGTERFATSLWADNTTFFHAANNTNIVDDNPVLSADALETALTQWNQIEDDEGEPIIIEAVHLVVPPALEITANRIANTIERRTEDAGGDTLILSGNGLPRQLSIHVNHYLPTLDDTTGDTSWYLFADPNVGRPAVEVGFLRGHEEPALFLKAPDAQRVGGGTERYDFDTDSIAYKMRHIWGGTVLDPRSAMRSLGNDVSE